MGKINKAIVLVELLFGPYDGKRVKTIQGADTLQFVWQPLPESRKATVEYVATIAMNDGCQIYEYVGEK